MKTVQKPGLRFHEVTRGYVIIYYVKFVSFRENAQPRHTVFCARRFVSLRENVLFCRLRHSVCIVYSELS